MMNILQEFIADAQHVFAAMNSEQSLTALATATILYLLGMWTGWLIWGRLANRRLRQIRKWESDFNTLQTEHTVLVGKHQKLTADYEGLIKEREGLEEQYATLDRERRTLKQQIISLKDENITLHTNAETYLRKIDTLDTQMLNLTTKNAQLQEELKSTANTVNSLTAVEKSYNSTKDRLTVVEARISDLVAENQDLRVELLRIKEVKSNEAHSPDAIVLPEDSPEKSADVVTTSDNEDENAILMARQQIQARLGTDIPLASVDEKDDLQRIDGVGPFIETQLNELGIYTFEQICRWDDDMIALVTTAIAFFPGRIQKDDWKGQACMLNIQKGVPEKKGIPSGKPSKKATVYADVIPPIVPLMKSKFKKKKANDLKIIEGIGPKIEQLLKDAGIQTWKDLANTNAEALQELLTAAGGRFRLAVPNTWPKQARLAVEGQWSELKDYQDRLNGGRESK